MIARWVKLLKQLQDKIYITEKRNMWSRKKDGKKNRNRNRKKKLVDDELLLRDNFCDLNHNKCFSIPNKTK